VLPEPATSAVVAAGAWVLPIPPKPVWLVLGDGLTVALGLEVGWQLKKQIVEDDEADGDEVGLPPLPWQKNPLHVWVGPGLAFFFFLAGAFGTWSQVCPENCGGRNWYTGRLANSLSANVFQILAGQ
jgi:hypothetical protein